MSGKQGGLGSRMKRLARLTVVLPLLGALAIALAAIGWHLQGKRIDDALFRSVGVLTASGDYVDSANWADNAWIRVARWFGLAFFLLTALKAFGLLLARQWAETRAQFSARDLVLVGDHPVLAALARLLARHRKVLWLAPEGQARIEGVGLVLQGWRQSLARRFRLHRARAILVAYADDDLQALDVGRSIAQLTREGEVAILSSALSVPAGLELAADVDRVRIMAPERLAIRSMHDGHPPFEIARRLGQRRIHALLLGCGQTGERVIADLLLSSLTTFLDKPRMTIVDPRAAEIRAGLLVRAPELGRSIDLDYATPDGSGDSHALPLAMLHKLAGEAPFSVAYLCLGSDRASLATALALDDIARREGWTLGTIFVRQRDSTAIDAEDDASFGRLVPFGRSEQLADALGLLGGEPDRLARLLHQAYRTAASRQGPANVDWDALPETLREANRLALVHLPAKLASAGVALDDWLAARRRLDPTAKLPPFPNLTADPALLDRLAALEHERWMAERRLAGWRYGPERDDARRLHPNLVPFAELPEAIRSYDVNAVLTLADALDRRR